MNEPNYDSFFSKLQTMTLLANHKPTLDAFREKYRQELFGLAHMMDRLGMLGSATSLHPAPPDNCDLCGKQLTEFANFVDGETESGLWASMCPPCYVDLGHSIAWGRGQLYRKIDGHQWRLISGGDPTAIED